MELSLLLDHRFFQDSDGVVFSIQNYNYERFAKRYLTVFDRIHVVGRVSIQAPEMRQGRSVSGPGVEVHSLGNWQAGAQFLAQRRTVTRRLNEILRMPNAVALFVPGTVGTLAYRMCLQDDRPFGVRVIGDPAAVFAPGVVEHPLRGFFRWWFARHLRQQCATASAVAYITEKALQERYPPSRDAFSNYYSQVDLPDSALAFGPRSHDVLGDSLRIITVGSLQQLYKSPDVLLEAMRLSQQRGLKTCLVWVGSGQYQQQMEAYAEKRGLAGQARFVGQVPAGEPVRALLDEADLFVLPSRTEGLPSALLEAMARALPCIGTRVGGIPELLVPEDTVAPDDSEALAQKLIEVASDPQRLDRMSERNLRKAKAYRVDNQQRLRDEFHAHLRQRTEIWLGEQQPSKTPTSM